MMVDIASDIGAPYIAIDKPSTPSKAGGNKTGKESTGNSAPFPFAFAMMAAIAVIADAMHILRMQIISQKNIKFPTMTLGRKNKNKPAPRNDNVNDKEVVNSSFPKNISIGEEDSFRRREVPRSSSMTKVLERPVMLPKNNTIQSNAEAT